MEKEKPVEKLFVPEQTYQVSWASWPVSWVVPLFLPPLSWGCKHATPHTAFLSFLIFFLSVGRRDPTQFSDLQAGTLAAELYPSAHVNFLRQWILESARITSHAGLENMRLCLIFKLDPSMTEVETLLI